MNGIKKINVCELMFVLKMSVLGICFNFPTIYQVGRLQ